MSALVIDTSSWVAYFQGAGDDEIEAGLKEGRVHLPPIVAAELMSGRISRYQRRQLAELLADLPLCATDLMHWFRVGELRAFLASKGLSVSTPDAHVAQCAMDLDAELLSLDGIYRQVARMCPLRLLAV